MAGGRRKSFLLVDTVECCGQFRDGRWAEVFEFADAGVEEGVADVVGENAFDFAVEGLFGERRQARIGNSRPKNREGVENPAPVGEEDALGIQ